MMTFIDEQKANEMFALLEKLSGLLPPETDPKHKINIDKFVDDRKTFKKRRKWYNRIFYGEAESLPNSYYFSLLNTLKYCRENISLDKNEQALFGELYDMTNIIVGARSKTNKV